MKFSRQGLCLVASLFFMTGYAPAQTLFKCELQDGKIAFQDTPCVQGKESARIETKDSPEKPIRKSRPRRDDFPPEPSVPQASAPKPAAKVPRPPRCPFVPVAGMDMKLVAQQQDMFTELFYVDDSRYSVAAQAAPAAPVPGKREIVDPRIAQCSALAEEYGEAGNELLKVPPKSLPSVQACFQKESQRLDGENRRIGCGFTHLKIRR